MSLTKVLGRIRGILPGNYPENREDEQFHMDCMGNAQIAQCLPPYTELIRLGESYISIGTAVNALTVAPTTTAQFALYNAEAHTGKSYVISHVGTIITGATAFITMITMSVQNCVTPVTNPLGGVVIKSLCGRQNYRGRGSTKASVAVTNDSAWHPVGTTRLSDNAAANIMLCNYWDVLGRYVVAPGGTFGVCSLTSTGAVSCQPFIIWHEVMLING